MASLFASKPKRGHFLWRMKAMKQFDLFRQNAAHLAECAASRPLHLRYKRMESAWRALADEQDWLDGCAVPEPTHAVA